MTVIYRFYLFCSALFLLALINFIAISSFFHWDLFGGWQGIFTESRMSWMLSCLAIRVQ